MTDKPARPALKNASSAPVIYFDAAPALGQSNGVVAIVLSTMMLSPQTDGQVITDAACVAHLRGTTAAIKSLRDACDKALAMLEPAQPANRDDGSGYVEEPSPLAALDRRLKAMQ